MRRRQLFPLLLVTACGGADEKQLTCGEGTKLEDGACVSTIVEVTCGTGTTLDPISGECLPDFECGPGTTFDATAGACVSTRACSAGTVLNPTTGDCDPEVVCGAGTTYNPTTRECEPDSVCGPGTVLDTSTGECVPDDVCGAGTVFDPVSGTCSPTLACGDGLVPYQTATGEVCLTPAQITAEEADAVEPVAEANDPQVNLSPVVETVVLEPLGSAAVFAGSIDRPLDLNGDSVVDQDRDFWRFAGGEGQLLRIRVISNGMPQPTFILRGPNGYERSSILGNALDANREVLLPYTGEYDVIVVPASYRLGGAPVGELETAKYVGLIEELAWPTPAAFAPGAQPAGATQNGVVLGLTDNFFAPQTAADVPFRVSLSTTGVQSTPVLLYFTADGTYLGELTAAVSSGNYLARSGVNPLAANEPILVVDWTVSNGDPTPFALTLATAEDAGHIGTLDGDGELTLPRTPIIFGNAFTYSFDAPAGVIVTTSLSGMSATLGKVLLYGPGGLYEQVTSTSSLHRFYTTAAGTYRWLFVHTGASDTTATPVVLSETPVPVTAPFDGTQEVVDSFSEDSYGELTAARRLYRPLWVLVDNDVPLLLSTRYRWRTGMPVLAAYDVDAGGHMTSTNDRRVSNFEDVPSMSVLKETAGRTLLSFSPEGSFNNPAARIRGWRLDVRRQPIPAVLEVEPNNLQADAETLPVLPARLTGSVVNGDSDLYVLDPSVLTAPLGATDALHVWLEGLDNMSALELGIYNSSFVKLYTTNGNYSLDWRIFANELAGGPYYLEVKTTANATPVRYLLDIEQVTQPVLELEPNNDEATAQSLGVLALADLPFEFQGVVEGGFDFRTPPHVDAPYDDTFSFSLDPSVPAGTSFFVSARHLGPTTSSIALITTLRLSAAPEDATVVEYTEGVYVFTPLTSGPFTLRVRRDGTTSHVPYRVRIEEQAAGEAEPNDSIGTPHDLGSLDTGAVEVFGVTQITDFDLDVFAYTLDTPLAAGEAIAIDWDNGLFRSDLLVSALDAGGDAIVTTSNYHGRLVIHPGSGTGPFFVSVTSNTASSDAANQLYRLQLSRLGADLSTDPAGAIITEIDNLATGIDNNTIASAQVLPAIEPPRRISAQSRSSAVALIEPDVYAITLHRDLAANEAIEVRAFIPLSDGSVQLRVLDPAGIELEVETQPDAQLRFVPPVATSGQTYYLEITLPTFDAGSVFYELGNYEATVGIVTF